MATKRAGNTRSGSASRTGGRKPKPLPPPLLAIGSEHKYVSRLLLILEEEADALRKTGQCDYDSMHRVIDYMTRFPDRYHHPKEDLIFDRMKGAATAKVIATLRSAHCAIAVENGKLDRELAAHEASPSRATARRLHDHVHEYCESLRAHMRLEESQVFAPALAQLTAADWRAIDEAIAPITDPVFGAAKASEYRVLLDRHLGRFVAVASGAVPLGLVETAAIATERMFLAAWHLGHLPARLVDAGRANVRAQMHSLAEVGRARDYASLKQSLEHYVDTCVEGGRVYASRIRGALQESEPLARGEAAEPTTLATDDDFLSFGHRPYTPKLTATVSWQATVTNLMFRLSLKPFLSHIGIDHARQVKAWIERSSVIPEGTRVSPVKGAGFSARWVHPIGDQRTRRTILYLPGGGFFFPAINGHTRMLARLAREAGCRGLLVDYRLAPEHPFPAGLEDAIAAYRYLLEHDVAPGDVVVAGDSAGGGLALSLLLAIRDEGLPLPAAGAVVSALADLSFTALSRQLNKWRDSMQPTRRETRAFDLYAGDTPRNDPLLSPIYGNFHGLPPLFAQVSGSEILLDDTLRVARKARAQGVDFELEIWEGLPHDWHLFAWMPESAKAVSRIAAFFREHLAQ
jgi:epsilon-lactone hydrolase